MKQKITPSKGKTISVSPKFAQICGESNFSMSRTNLLSLEKKDFSLSEIIGILPSEDKITADQFQKEVEENDLVPLNPKQIEAIYKNEEKLVQLKKMLYEMGVLARKNIRLDTIVSVGGRVDGGARTGKGLPLCIKFEGAFSKPTLMTYEEDDEFSNNEDNIDGVDVALAFNPSVSQKITASLKAQIVQMQKRNLPKKKIGRPRKKK